MIKKFNLIVVCLWLLTWSTSSIACTQAETTQETELKHYLEGLKLSDTNNAWHDITMAIALANQDKLSHALQALKRASQQSISNDYYWQHFHFRVNQIKAQQPTLQTPELVAIHDTPVATQQYQSLMALCVKQAGLDAHWKQTCLTLATLLETQGNSFFANMMGLAIQREILNKHEPDSTLLALVLDRRAALNQWRIDALEQLEFLNWEVPAPQRFYQDLITYGEREAINRALTAKQESNH